MSSEKDRMHGQKIYTSRKQRGSSVSSTNPTNQDQTLKYGKIIYTVYKNIYIYFFKEPFNVWALFSTGKF